MNLAERINALLADKIASPGDGSLLQSALTDRFPDFPDAPVSANETELAYLRVEVLLAAWEELHRERATLDRLIADPRFAHRMISRLEARRALDGLYPGEDYAIGPRVCANCGRVPHLHLHEDGFGFVCPEDAAARTDEERFTYTA